MEIYIYNCYGNTNIGFNCLEQQPFYSKSQCLKKFYFIQCNVRQKIHLLVVWTSASIKTLKKHSNPSKTSTCFQRNVICELIQKYYHKKTVCIGECKKKVNSVD